jgi:hypothetical protein
MTQHTVTLEYTADHNGQRGFILEGGDDERLDASTDGQLLAHDILEHMNGSASIGSTADELFAFGAICFIRGHEYGAKQIGRYDLVSVFENWDPESEPLTPVADVIIDDEGDGDIFIRDVWRAMREGIANSRTYREPMTDEVCAEFENAVYSLLRAGWLEASKRYHTRDQGNALFHAVASEIRNTECDWDRMPIMHVSYDTDRQTASTLVEYADE